jgi:hypothetical protein
MKPLFSSSYLDSLFASCDYGKLIELSGLIYGSPAYHSDIPNYGLPVPAFIFVESLLWFAQAIRSGTWTYFEATPVARQEAMRSGLERMAPAAYAMNFTLGMRNWQDPERMDQVDRWIEAHEEENTHWLWRMVNEHRSEIQALFA